MNFAIKILKKRSISIVFALVFGFLALNIVLRAADLPVGEAYLALFNGVFGTPQDISTVIIRSAPLMLTGLGVAFAYKTGLFNIGAEGQFLLGTFATAITSLSLPFHPVIVIPLAILSGMLAGAVWGGFCGFLKAKFGINEVITSIMLNWIALHLGNMLLEWDYLKNPSNDTSKPIDISRCIVLLPKWKNSPAAKAWAKENPFLASILRKTDVNFGIVIAIASCIIVSYLIYKTKKGFELRAVGLNKYAAELAGINVNKNILHSMLISGAICGLSGSIVILGMGQHVFSQLTAFENYGFNGLAVAFLAMASPIGCIFAGLLFGALLNGGAELQSTLSAPSEVINIMIGVLVFLMALNSAIPLIANKLERRNIMKHKKEANS